MVETVCYVDVALWCVPVTLEFSQGEYGAAAWCREASIDLGTFNRTTWPVGRSKVAGLGVFQRSTNTRCYTH